MTRPLRVEYPGAVYHITAHGNQRKKIFLDDIDRRIWLSIFEKTYVRYNWVCYAYCLMSNHYHAVIETPDGNLSKGMRHLNGVYTQSSNRKHNRVGHIFQGRFGSILVDKDSYLLELCRYVELNPVRAKMVTTAMEWPWSSIRVITGRAPHPSWLLKDVILSYFATDKQKAMKAYGDFVNAGMAQPSIWDNIHNQIFLGDKTFVEQHQKFLPGDTDLSEIPGAQRKPPAKQLSSYKKEFANTREAMAHAYLSGHYSLKVIGQYFGVHYSTVSRAVKQLEKKDKLHCKT